MKSYKSPIRLSLLTIIFTVFIFLKANSQTAADFTTISDRIFNTFQSSGGATSDTQVNSLVSTLNSSYGWPDINYSSTSQTDWVPGYHLARMATMAKAYSNPSSTYYGDPDLKEKIEGTMNYWLTLNPAPSSTNWFYLSISVPKDIGNILICLRKSPEGISAALENQMIAWMTKGVAITASPARDGSNLTDVAQHYIMRACLTENQTLLNQTISAVTSSIVVTTGEGIQNDNSYTAHGPQLYVYGYGREYISGISNIAVYVAGTSYAFPADKLAIFSDFVRKGFIKPSRGSYADFNLYGRGVSRANAGRADVGLIEKVRNFDLPQHATEYDHAIQRMRGLQPASYNVSAEHIHYWRTDYTVHHRPGYMFGLRSVSSRNAKSEMGNGENIKGYYLTEGVNYIGVNGDEYYNIFPVWEWNKIPGTTVPEITTYPVRTSWGVNFGTVPFVGGVSDGIYGASTYSMSDYGTTAKKSWFYFDEEIVCLGAGINSSATQPINTTVNQCLLKTDVTVSDAVNNVSVLNGGIHDYTNNLKWALQGNVGYFFPKDGNITISNQTQTGSWSSINTTGSTAALSTDVFKLWIKHGTAPANASYAYIVTPGKTSATQMQNYNAAQISILSNTPAIQAVRHNGLGIWQVVFYQAGEFTSDQITVKVSKPCVVMLKNVTDSEVTVHVSDPSQNTAQIYLGVKTPQFTALRASNFNMPQGADAGSTVNAIISNANPIYQLPVEPMLKLTSTADAFVRSGGSGSTAVHATTNYGSDPVLTIKKESAGYDREVFVKFDLSTFSASPDSAVIQLRVNNANTAVANTRWGFYLVEDNTWTEAAINWNNKPAHTTKLGELTGASAGSVVKLNITQAVINRLTADKILSVRVASEPTTTDAAVISKTDGAFNARENMNADYRPQIWIYGKVPEVTEEVKKDSILAVADSYVRSNGNAANNYGTQGYLVARNKSDDMQEIYLKFDMHGLRKGLVNAKVRLYALENGINTAWNLTLASNTYATSTEAWQETGINWNNKPVATDLIVNTTSTATAGYVYFDITSALASISSDSILTFKITATTDLYSSFRSRNFGTDLLRPKIIYEYATQTTSLPVTLSYFKGDTKNGAVDLSWETSSEKSNDYFEIQRSEDGRTFQAIASVSGNNTTTDVNRYSYQDRGWVLSYNNIVYYRLRQVDYDGSSTLSSIVAITLPKTDHIFSVGPNPTQGKLTVFVKDSYAGPLTFTIVNREGMQITEKHLTRAVLTEFQLDPYPPGLYFLKIKMDNQPQQIFKFVLSK
ncbi:polysaccharide lyase family 8 super-sandwich domain-containing protein [Dyadobacter sp. CY312]|uniref:polysaccharide lyase family 8 super-sandwich domain-containing protein n=1 Tax=Dyadobacter sp. CY312 TaxID=2907303 RepID=UPI001F3F7E15|nr:polysaccharide lyase family 8 super-sandwich domain-containing protein [Dyadobacter sp. CY312]MCE7044513.1 DNRLRE domain-containing protein [Dyadobacter sp. CY312]